MFDQFDQLAILFWLISAIVSHAKSLRLTFHHVNTNCSAT
jgi:hypothetical protein